MSLIRASRVELVLLDTRKTDSSIYSGWAGTREHLRTVDFTTLPIEFPTDIIGLEIMPDGCFLTKKTQEDRQRLARARELITTCRDSVTTGATALRELGEGRNDTEESAARLRARGQAVAPLNWPKMMRGDDRDSLFPNEDTIKLERVPPEVKGMLKEKDREIEQLRAELACLKKEKEKHVGAND